MGKQLKLHIGAGTNVAKGWINYDIEPIKGVVYCDIRNPLPHKNNTVDMIFSEHVIEHLTKKEGKQFLQECHRVLKPGGSVRIAWPGLEKLIRAYVVKDRRFKDFIIPHLKYEFRSWDEILSDCLFSWDHRYAYTSRHLTMVLEELKFKDVKRQKYMKSDYGYDIDLRNDPSTSYLEARKH